jgi:carbon-monoxide dehydrogenase large subunit
MVYIDIEPLTAVVELDDALLDATLVHPALGTNTYATFDSDHQATFTDCEVVLDLRVVNQRINGSPIEPRSGLAYWEPQAEGDRLVHYSACQGAHPTRDILAKLYDMPADRVRVVVPDVGGGFGVKSRTIGEELTLGWLSKKVGTPVRYTETRTEAMQAMPQGRGQRIDVKIGGSRDGRVTAYHLDVVQDAGAYPLMGAYLPMMTQRMAPGVYDIQNCSFHGVSVATNKISVTAYRGAGRPEAALAIERAIDFFAAEIGMDPAEVRARNFIPKFMEPFTTGIGTTYDVGDYAEAMRRALDAADYPALRAAQDVRRESGSTVQTGIGIAVYVEITSAAAPTEYGAVHLLADGRMRVLTGATPYGQGHVTTWKMIIADRLGVPMESVDVVHGDTDEVPSGGLTVGSRSVQVAGSSLVIAAAKLVDAARERAADLLEAAVEDVVLDSDAGTFHVAGSALPAIGWADVAAVDGEPLVGLSDFKAAQPTFPFGAHIAVVDVDTETGKVTVQRIIAVDDAGTLLNPLIVDGQIHGGIGQGVAQALLEWMQYDEDGNPVTSNFADYPVISAAELPTYELVHMETPTWVNPLGAKGAGESGTIGSIPAVLNAVIDALSPLGVRHLDGPATPQRVWDAIQMARQ